MATEGPQVQGAIPWPQTIYASKEEEKGNSIRDAR